jgi:hypothetical protein
VVCGGTGCCCTNSCEGCSGCGTGTDRGYQQAGGCTGSYACAGSGGRTSSCRFGEEAESGAGSFGEDGCSRRRTGVGLAEYRG